MKIEIKRINGVLKIDIDGKPYAPLSFKSFRPNAQNISEFYKAGVRLFSVFSTGVTSALGVPYSLFGESWIGEGQYDFTAIDRQMDLFIEHAPDAYFAPMLQVDTREWYLSSHPDIPNSFTHLSQIAYDEAWRKAASDYLKAAIRHCEEKYGDRIYGYFLMGGTTTEWFSNRDKEASHPIKEAGYRKWSGDDSAALPSLERLNRSGDTFLDSDEKDVFAARRFHAETISDLVLYFAQQAQTEIQHRKLLGVYFGYLFELGGERLYNDGSLDYERVFYSPDINMISSPSAYGYRGLTDPSAFMVTQKTLDDQNKLYFLEFDHITHVAPTEIHNDSDVTSSNQMLVKIPGHANKCKNETESLNLMYRDFLLCNANRAALWWFDMFDGWFRSDGMMRAVSNMIETEEILADRQTGSVAEIAVFAEGKSMYRARKSAKLATVCLSDIRRTLAECGCAYDLCTMGDFYRMKHDQYRVFLFVNQYDLPESEREKIRSVLKESGKTAVWLYAPAYATNGACLTQEIRDVIGMNVTESRSSHGGIVYHENVTKYDIAAPYFAIDDPNAHPIAFFEDGTVAVAERCVEGYRSVYAATCNLPSALLRDIAAKAGVFVYSRNSRVYAYPNSATVGVYNATEEEAIISLPEDGRYRDLIENESFSCENGTLSLPPKPIRAYLLVKEG